MPSIKDQTTVQAIAREYCSNGRDKAGAMRTIGYAESSCKSGKAVGDVYGNLRVKAAIGAIDEAGADRAERTVQSVDSMYQEAYDLARDTKQSSSMVSAVTGIARLYGMDKDVQASPDQPLELTPDQLLEAHRAGNVALATTTKAQEA